MLEWARVAGIVGLALVIGVTIVLAGPLGKALAERIRGRSRQAATPSDGETQLAEELDQLKRRMAEIEERVDFHERLVARDREADRLMPPRRAP